MNINKSDLWIMNIVWISRNVIRKYSWSSLPAHVAIFIIFKLSYTIIFKFWVFL
jgi:hypothetical protein